MTDVEGENDALTTAAAAPAALPPGTRISLYVILLLALMNTLNYLDRQVISILAQLIKVDLKLADWQLGVLTGLAFAIFYTVCAIPIARFAERVHRPAVMSASVAVWSLFTLACGFAQNFPQLALARLGVGLGEAGGTPPAHALISDGLPPERRAFGIGVFSAGIPVGGLLGMVFGGLVADRFGWRTAFMLAGVPGLFVAALLALTVREPRGGTLRGDLRRLRQPRSDGIGVWTAARELLAKRSFLLISLGAASGGFVNYVHAAFFSAFFLRAHTAGLAQAARGFSEATGYHVGPVGFLGLSLGLLGGTLGLIGTLAGGWITDAAAKRDIGAYTLVPGLAKTIAVPLAIAMVLVGNVGLAILLGGLVELVRGASFAPSFSSVQWLVRPALRPTAAALLFFIINLLGLGIGPLAVGALSDIVAAAGLGPVEGLRVALICAELVGLAGASFYFIARAAFVRDVAANTPAYAAGA